MINLITNHLRLVEDSYMSRRDKALLRCELAKEMEEAGDYEAAQASLGDLWRGIMARPDVKALDTLSEAMVLLRAGALSGWLGSARQIAGAQEWAKDLINESIRSFEALGAAQIVIEAQAEMALCYWREGAFDEARVILHGALNQVGEVDKKDRELKAIVLLRLAIVESKAQRFTDALRFLTAAAPLIEANDKPVLKGKLHVQLALALRNLAAIENREDYIDRALVEYAAASFYFEQAKHMRYCGRVENNLAMLFLKLHRHAEAHEHLDRARELFKEMKDTGSSAQVDETRARVLLAEGRCREAEALARRCVQVLEQGGEQPLLAEALQTHGMALACLKLYDEARAALERAIEVAVQAGDTERAGMGALIMIEALVDHLAPDVLCATYQHADALLSHSENNETLQRLRSCARLTLNAAAKGHLFKSNEAQSSAAAPELSAHNGFAGTLFEEVRRYEAELIRRALVSNSGSVTRAAAQLGVTHQSLSFILHNRHKALLDAKKPRKRRRTNVIRATPDHN